MKPTLHSTLAAIAFLGWALSGNLWAGSDNFVDATNLNDNNWPSAVSILTFTAETNEPGHKSNGNTGALKSAWWKWTAPADGFCTLDTMAQFDDQHVYDTILAVYTGTAVDALTRVAANSNHDTSLSYASSSASSVTFYATAGVTYHIAVDGSSAGSVNANNHKVRLRLRHLYGQSEQRLGIFGIPEDDFMQGSIQLTKTAGHSYSGKLLLNGKSYPLKGVFGIDGYSSHSIERKVPAGQAPQPPLTLLLDGTRGSEFALVSHLYGGAWYGILHTQQKFAKGQESGLKGRYSATIKYQNNTYWDSGALAFTTSGSGAVKGAGVLTDGTKVTLSSYLCVKDGTSSYVPFYNGLYKNKGYLTVTMILTEGGAIDHVTSVDLSSEFHRPAAPGATFLPDGLTYVFGVDVIGATYTPPAANARALGFLDGTSGAGTLNLTMVSGEIDPAIMEAVTFTTKNTFTFASLTRKPTLKLNKATGMVTGSIQDDDGKKRNLTGVLYLDGMTPKLQGHVSGVTQNTPFAVVP